MDGEFRPVGTSDSVVFADVPTGQRSVTLGNMPPGCTPSPTLPVSVTVVAGGTARLGIVVACVTTTGALTFDMTRR